jgi:hypothetical protein
VTVSKVRLHGKKGTCMSVFVTYARENAKIVDELRKDIERVRRPVWLDRETGAGDDWWSKILDQIEATDLYVFAVSQDSIRSRACLRELEYAGKLNRALLAVKVSNVSLQQAPEVIASAQVIDYRKRTADSVMTLRDALDHVAGSPPLPMPLPDRPETPMSYLGRYRELLTQSVLTYEQQQWLFVSLKGHCELDEDRADATDLLRALLGRPELATSIATDVRMLLDRGDATSNHGTSDRDDAAGADAAGSPDAAASEGGEHSINWKKGVVRGIAALFGLSILGSMIDCFVYGYC